MNSPPAGDLHHAIDQAQVAILEIFNQLRRQTEAAAPKPSPAPEPVPSVANTGEKLVSLVAHDIIAPTGAILRLLELIFEDEEHPVHGEHREMLAYAITSSRDMLRLIKNLLDMSRVRSGKLILEPTFFDARQLAEELLYRMSPHGEQKGVHLLNGIDPNTRVKGDRLLLGEVMQNLLSNAIKFSPRGSRVILSAEQVGRETVIHVRDQGVGIDAERLPGLFRVDGKTTTRGTDGEAGTGFGLPYSRDLMAAHGGDLTVASQLDAGSCFSMHLPRAKPRVLVVDDLRTARKLFRGVLEPMDVEVMEAGDGREALTLVASVTPDLIIADIIMPEVDGFELLTRLKVNAATAVIPVIMVTTDEQVETRNRAFALGAVDFVNKPIDLCDFIPRIRHVIG